MLVALKLLDTCSFDICYNREKHVLFNGFKTTEENCCEGGAGGLKFLSKVMEMLVLRY